MEVVRGSSGVLRFFNVFERSQIWYNICLLPWRAMAQAAEVRGRKRVITGTGLIQWKELTCVERGLLMRIGMGCNC